MKYIYKLNSNASGGYRVFDIEADGYKLSDGFFNFFEKDTGGYSSNVASVEAKSVFDIKRTDKSN